MTPGPGALRISTGKAKLGLGVPDQPERRVDTITQTTQRFERYIKAAGHRHPALARTLPFALLIAGIALDGVLKGHAAALPWDLRWDYAWRSALCALALGVLWPACSELASRPRLDAQGAMLGSLVGVAVFALWIAPPLRAFTQTANGFDLAHLGRNLPLPGGSGFRPLRADGSLDWGLALPRLLGSALVVPLAEELFWRGLVMRWIDQIDFRSQDPRAVSPRALLLQAVLFGLEHDLWLAGMAAGLAYGWLYRHTGKLWTGVVAHAVTNGLLGLWVLRNSNWSYW